MRFRIRVYTAGVVPLLALAACGGGGGGGSVASTPMPPVTPPPVVTPPPPPPVTPPPTLLDSTEYRRSNSAVQARALTAYEAGATGAGVLAGIIDSGINQSSGEFAGKISPLSADLAGNRGLQDESGHGTAVASVLLGAKNDSGAQGIAYGATLLVLRTDTPGSCSPINGGGEDSGCSHNDNAIAVGVDRAVTANARVVNISLGGAPANPALRNAIDRATAAGVIIVISAGNDFDTDPTLGANPDPLALIATTAAARGLVLIAGATDAAQNSAAFSNKAGSGAAFYLTALGVRVRAVDQAGASLLFSGTSFAAPAVAGAVALLTQAFPTLTPTQIVDLLLRTATDLGAPGVDAIYGRGELNLERAFAPQGQTSLGNTAVAVSLTGNATLSPPMGDAGKTGLAATIRDGYGRRYAVDLAPTLAVAARASRLAPALAVGVRSLAAQRGGASFALAVSDDTPRRLRLAPGDAAAARALAGSVALRVAAGTSVALGIAQGSEALARSLASNREAPFLVSSSAAGAQGLGRAPTAAMAVRQQVGRFGVTLASERGEMRLWESDLDLRQTDRRQPYAVSTLGLDTVRGALGLSAGVTRLTERDTVLGARFSPAFGGGGAASWFADLGATLTPDARWRLAAGLRHGWTSVTGDVLRNGSTLATRALSFDIERRSLFASTDSLAIRWSQPLRVTSGALLLTGLDAPTRLDLAPGGSERTIETVYARAVGTGWLTGNLYVRHQPDNIAAAPDDVGLAVRYAVAF